MSKITCPNCKEEFKLNNLDSSLIIKQIRDEEFDTEIEKRLDELTSKINDKHDLELLKLNAILERKDQEKFQSETQVSDRQKKCFEILVILCLNRNCVELRL